MTQWREEVIGGCTLYRGDCLDILPTITTGSVDMVLCDLPYGTTQNKWDSVLPLDRLWADYWRVVKPNGVVVLTAQTPFDKVLGVSCLRHLKYEWIWEKTEATGHLNAKRCPMKAHENALVFYRSLPTYNPQMTAGHDRKTAKQVNAKQSTNYGNHGNKPRYDSSERYPRSIQAFPTDKQREPLHPTQKPVALMEYLIKTYTNAGETVIDNTMGSGTTGVACARIDRRFIGIEFDTGYFEIASRRIKEEYAQGRLFSEGFLEQKQKQEALL